MSLKTNILIGSALIMATILINSAAVSADPQVAGIKRAISGQKYFVSHREGGPVYGTYFFQEIHFCPSGQYILYGQSRRQTVLGNEQVNNWQDHGNWEVLRVQNQTAVRYLSAYGNSSLIQVSLLPGGGVTVPGGYSIQPKGLAQCR